MIKKPYQLVDLNLPPYFLRLFSRCEQVDSRERPAFSIGIDGKYYYCVTFFCSPLGARASYAAIDLIIETGTAITNALNQMFPKMLPFGLSPVSKN
jgi:hypothetical protein